MRRVIGRLIERDTARPVGFKPGAIASEAFPTKRGATYTVTFLLSGTGGQGPLIKTMTIKAAGQLAECTWNTASGNDVEDGIYAPQTWRFVARSALTTLVFIRDDPPSSGRGAVVAAIAATKN